MYIYHHNLNTLHPTTLTYIPSYSPPLLLMPPIGGYIYVCGATAMGEDVAHAIVEVVQKYKG